MVLAWRGDQTAKPLLEKVAVSGSPLARLHALHALGNAGVMKTEILTEALRAPQPELRAAALRLAESSTDEDIIAAALQLTGDRDAEVRLQAALSLGTWEGAVADQALALLARSAGEDAHLRAAVLSSAVPHLTLLSMTLPEDSPLQDDVLQTALGEKQHESILPRLRALFDSAKLAEAARTAKIVSALALLHSKQASLESIVAQHPGDTRWADLLHCQKELFAQVKQLLPSASAAEQGIYASLLLTDPREAPAAVEVLGGLVAPGAAREGLAANVRRLAQTGDDRVTGYLLGGWEQRTPAEREVLLDALMSREAWISVLLAAVRENKIAPSSFDAQRQARLLKHPAAGVRKLAGEIFAAGTSTRQQAIDAFYPCPGTARRGWERREDLREYLQRVPSAPRGGQTDRAGSALR